MNTDQMMNRLRSHPVMCEIGMELAMGFPVYRVRSGVLRAVFLPHRQQWSGDRAEFFRPAYRVEFAFPFRHLCRFENLVLAGAAGAGEAVFRRDAAVFRGEYGRAAAEIHALSDRILEEASLKGAPCAEALAEYRRELLRAVGGLGLSDVYGSEAEQNVFDCGL